MIEEFKKVDEDTVLYNDTYKLCRNGNIVSPSGKVLSKYNFAYPYSHVTLFIGDKVIKKNAAILIYKAFSEEGVEYNVYKNEIQFLDNDTNNTQCDNSDNPKDKREKRKQRRKKKLNYQEKPVTSIRM